MFLDTRKQRNEYFDFPNVTQILRSFLGYVPGHAIGINDLKILEEQGKLIVGTKEGDLQGLRDKKYTLDTIALIEKIKNKRPDQLLVLPPEYIHDDGQARDTTTYSFNSLLYLDNADVKRRLIDGKIPKGKFSRKQREKFQWEPEKVLTAVFDILHENKEKHIDKNYYAYYWYGLNNERRIVSPYECIRAAELLTFSDYAEIKQQIKDISTQINTKKSLLGEDLSKQKIAQLASEVSKLRNYLTVNKIYTTVMRKLKTSEHDIFEVPPRGDNSLLITLRDFFTTSRSRPGQAHQVRLNGIPITRTNDPIAYSQVWELRSKSMIENTFYMTDRRKRKAYYGQDEIFFAAGEIAFFHKLRRIYEKHKNLGIKFNPFVLPTKETMDYTDNLRYGTIVLVDNFETDRWSKRELNHIELSSFLMKKAIADNYKPTFTTDISELRKQGYNIRNELLKFSK